jgi:hypothetical protein
MDHPNIEILSNTRNAVILNPVVVILGGYRRIFSRLNNEGCSVILLISMSSWNMDYVCFPMSKRSEVLPLFLEKPK